MKLLLIICAVVLGCHVNAQTDTVNFTSAITIGKSCTGATSMKLGEENYIMVCSDGSIEFVGDTTLAVMALVNKLRMYEDKAYKAYAVLMYINLPHLSKTIAFKSDKQFAINVKEWLKVKERW